MTLINKKSVHDKIDNTLNIANDFYKFRIFQSAIENIKINLYVPCHYCGTGGEICGCNSAIYIVTKSFGKNWLPTFFSL
jgi:hypothetical protein